VRAGKKSPDDMPCRYSNGNIADTDGDLRAHGGIETRSEPPFLIGFGIDWSCRVFTSESIAS